MWSYSHQEALRFLQKAGEYDSVAELEGHFAKVLEAFGFDRYRCMKFEPGAQGAEVISLSGQGMDEWHRHWTEQGYAEIDPVLQLALARRPVFTWSDARAWSRQQHGQLSGREQQLWGEASDAGMGDGLISHSYGPGGELLVVRMATGAASVRPADRPLLDAVAIVFANIRWRLFERDGAAAERVLTRREEQCLRWASQGLVDAEIGEQLGITAKTVAFHMENAKRKLGARTRMAAYRRALELGHLTI